MRSSTRRRTLLVRSMFLAVIALLTAQAAYAYAVQEPYPSFAFPSFEGAPDDQGPVRLLRPRLMVRFIGSDEPIEVPYQRVFDPAPGVVADAIAYTVFAPPSLDAAPRSIKGQFRLFLQQPVFIHGGQSLSPALRDPRTRVWLRSRLAHLFPGRTPRSVEVRWLEHRRAADGPSESETVTTVAELHVPLEG